MALNHGVVNLVEGGDAVGFVGVVDGDDALAIEVDDLRSPVGIIGAQLAAFHVVRCGGGLHGLLFLLLGVATSKDSHELSSC